jgi:hypothetical protein
VAFLRQLARQVLRSFGSGREFWTFVPNSALFLVLGAVFFLFSTLALTTDISLLGRMSPQALALAAILSGGTAMAYLLALAKGLRFLPIALVLHVIAITNSFNLIPFTSTRPTPRLAESTDGALRARLRFDAFALTTAVMLGYGLFIGFIGGQGKRYMRMRTEIALATEIHQLLVPPIDRRIGSLEFFGLSRASGEVGGDLVDLVELDRGWVAYLADVSGHGVASGALMGMFKSAFRSRMTTDALLGNVLADVNRVLLDLRKPGMFVTVRSSPRTRTVRFTSRSRAIHRSFTTIPPPVRLASSSHITRRSPCSRLRATRQPTRRSSVAMFLRW